AFEAGGDHVVDGVAAAAADTEDGDAGLQLSDVRLLQLDGHCTRSFRFRPLRPAGLFLAMSLSVFPGGGRRETRQKLSFSHWPMRAMRPLPPVSCESMPPCTACSSSSANCG